MDFLKEEEGSAMIIGAAGLIVIILFMALVVDMGLYYSEYRKLKSASDFADEEIQQMMPLYAYASDYQEIYRKNLTEALAYMGYTSANITNISISRTNGIVNGGWVISVNRILNLEDTYHCLLLPIIGIDELPIKTFKNDTTNMPIEKPYSEGQPFEVWGEEKEGS